jgi:hypothetical protein
MDNDQVLELQRLYPQIYLACHVDHVRSASSLTRRGAEAMASTSVLDAARVRKMLESLSPEDRAAAMRGLALLGIAARRMSQQAAAAQSATGHSTDHVNGKEQ